MIKLRIAGHETFTCKHFWLKKGFDFLNEGHSFNDPDAVTRLGVGRNMVNAIKFWMEAFGVTDESEISGLGAFLFLKNEGCDPFLEDPASLWLLHYRLATKGYASIYGLVFNELRKERSEFGFKHLHNLAEKIESGLNEGTLRKDWGVFVNTYLSPTQKSRKIKSIEDEFSTILHELDLLLPARGEKTAHEEGNSDFFRIENKDRANIPAELILYAVLDNPAYSDTVSFDKLLNDHNSPGSIFAMTSEGLYAKIIEITDKYPGIVYTDDAGIRTLQFKQKPDKQEVLQGYYEKQPCF